MAAKRTARDALDDDAADSGAKRGVLAQETRRVFLLEEDAFCHCVKE